MRALKEKPTATPHIHIAHATPYWLASCPTATRDGAIRNLHTFVTKAHNYREVRTTQNKYPYVEKWLSNDQINQKLSNHFWKNNKITDAQITQTLKFSYAQYMGNHRKNIFWPLKFQNPNCTLCHKNDRDTWPHLLSMCEHPYLKGLRIARHNKAVHLITQTLQANKHTRYYTLTNAGNLNNNRPRTNRPRMAHRMHMPTNKLPMPRQTKTRHPLHTRSPKPHPHTLTTLTHTHNTIHWIHILPRQIPRTSHHTKTSQIWPIN